MFGAATLQLLNPKVWMMAVAVASVFVGGGDKTTRLGGGGGVVAGVPVGLLAVHDPVGIARGGERAAFGSPQAFKRANYALAFLLLVSAWLTVLA